MAKKSSKRREEAPSQQAARPASKDPQRWVGWACGGALLFAWSQVFGSLFPTAKGTLGHDYYYMLPQLLSGYFWAQVNGYFSVPWFTPGFCAGVPAFPNPQNFYFSAPQLFTQAMSPLAAVKWTAVLFAGAGFLGTWRLARDCFGLSRAAAALSGAVFMWNGFYAYRLAVGHLPFHAFALVPLLAWLLLRAGPEGAPPAETRWRAAAELAAAGLVLGYMVHAGFVNGMAPALLSIVALGLVHLLSTGKGALRFFLRLGAAGAIGLLLSAAHLAAAGAFLESFSRADYKLPGASTALGGLGVLLQSLFFFPAHEQVATAFTNTQWALDRHELEYSVSPVPLLMLLLWAGAAARRRPALVRPGPRTLAAAGALALIVLLPWALNVYTPEWNALLKQLPLLKASSSLLRWLLLEIAPLALVCGLALDRVLESSKLRVAVAAGGVLACVGWAAAQDRAYYQEQKYDPRRVETAWSEARTRGAPPAISRVEQKSNDALAQGISPFPCYEPVFGYRLEALPVKTLHPGPLLEAQGGVLNLKNPACYVWPAANECALGDHFAASQAPWAEAFVAWKPFPFRTPPLQTAASAMSLATLLALTGFLTAFSVRRFSKR